MESFFKLRVSPNDQYHRELLVKLSQEDYILSCLAVTHVGSTKTNSHIHAIIGVKHGTTQRALAIYLQRHGLSKGKGNQYKTITAIKFEGSEPYQYLYWELAAGLVADDPTFLATPIYTEEVCDGYKTKAQEFEANKAALKKISKKSKAKFYIQMAYPKYKESLGFQALNGLTPTEFVASTTRDIKVAIFKTACENNINPPQDFHARAYTRAIQQILIKEHPALYEAMINLWVDSSK